jgi:antitoxin (DNA-binding transcriptional repressor) of toxin-antitoxin stability system
VLGQYLREVNAGETIEVTDRGQVIAVINPPGTSVVTPTVPPRLVALANRDRVTQGARTPGYRYPVLPAKRRRRVTAAQLLDKQRGDR